MANLRRSSKGAYRCFKSCDKPLVITSASIASDIARKYAGHLILNQLAKAHYEGGPYRGKLVVDTWDALPPQLMRVFRDAPESYKEAVAEEMKELAERFQ